MSVESTAITSAPSARSVPTAPAKPVRLWPALSLVTLFWVAFFVVGSVDKFYFYGFLYAMASSGLLALLFFGWWWTFSRIRLLDRFLGFLLIVGGAVGVAPFVDASVGGFGLFLMGLPVVLTVWTLWMLVGRLTALSWFRPASLVVIALSWMCFTLYRTDGANSDLRADMHWRWTPTAEDLFLAKKKQEAANAGKSEQLSLVGWKPSLDSSDWTEFRGTDRACVIRGVTLATDDWNTTPDRRVWRTEVGPAWSSVIIIGNRLFTQEQRGDQETVVCYDALTGKELWVHEDTARFYNSVSGAGPNATPTFADGRIYTLGGTGILNCLDAATGEKFWSRDIKDDSGAKDPMWGFSSSPLVVDDLVIVFAGGEGENNLLAYRAKTGGKPVWTAPAGQSSYSSPQLATIGGQRQCLMLSDSGLTAVDPTTGAVLWKSGIAMPGAPRTVQPRALDASQLVVGTLDGPGVSLIDVTRKGETWNVDQRWESKDLRPQFPDFVVHQGHAYGFDVNVFCCIDLSNGQRCWRGGRYGCGQVLLLEDQSLLLVISEKGEAILVAADPEKHKELGRFQALDGKTWNHPVIAHGRLYLRNDKEMACYELKCSPRP
jgi:outer membrane protein assembly factor BamB